MTPLKKVILIIPFKVLLGTGAPSSLFNAYNLAGPTLTITYGPPNLVGVCQPRVSRVFKDPSYD